MLDVIVPKRMFILVGVVGVNLSRKGIVGWGKVECVSLSKSGVWRHFVIVLYGVLTNVFWLGRETGDNRVPAASTTTRNEEMERKMERAEGEKETSSLNNVDLMPSIPLFAYHSSISRFSSR